MRIRKNLLSIVIIFAGVLFLAIGTMRGEHAAVLLKATRLCLECVGIG